jgi:Acyl-CoA carboxylase epsilon subunit
MTAPTTAVPDLAGSVPAGSVHILRSDLDDDEVAALLIVLQALTRRPVPQRPAAPPAGWPVAAWHRPAPAPWHAAPTW